MAAPFLALAALAAAAQAGGAAALLYAGSWGVAAIATVRIAATFPSGAASSRRADPPPASLRVVCCTRLRLQQAARASPAHAAAEPCRVEFIVALKRRRQGRRRVVGTHLVHHGCECSPQALVLDDYTAAATLGLAAGGDREGVERRGTGCYLLVAAAAAMMAAVTHMHSTNMHTAPHSSQERQQAQHGARLGAVQVSNQD